MTIYQKELLRHLSALNCTGHFDNVSGMLRISLNGIPLCTAGKKGELYWKQEKLITEEQKEATNALQKTTYSIREYVSLYESAPSLGIDDLPEYRRISEYDDVVLGAMYSEQYGFMFSTWRQDKGKQYVVHGDYTTDYEYAKESFITRSGLVNESHLFSPEEAKNLYRCVRHVRESCDTLTYEEEQQLKALSEKLTDGYPQIDEEIPSFDEDTAPQLNM